MVKAIVDIPEKENRVLNIVKAKYGLHDKSEALVVVIKHYEEEILEPELRPEFIRKMKRVKKQKGIRFKSIEDLRKDIEA